MHTYSDEAQNPEFLTAAQLVCLCKKIGLPLYDSDISNLNELLGCADGGFDEALSEGHPSYSAYRTIALQTLADFLRYEGRSEIFIQARKIAGAFGISLEQSFYQDILQGKRKSWEILEALVFYLV